MFKTSNLQLDINSMVLCVTLRKLSDNEKVVFFPDLASCFYYIYDQERTYGTYGNQKIVSIMTANDRYEIDPKDYEEIKEKYFEIFNYTDGDYVRGHYDNFLKVDTTRLIPECSKPKSYSRLLSEELISILKNYGEPGMLPDHIESTVKELLSRLLIDENSNGVE